MKFQTALIHYSDTQQQQIDLDQSYESKLAELNQAYATRKEKLKRAFHKAEALLNTEREALSLDDPRIALGSRAVRIVGDWSLAGRDGEHCCQQAAFNLAKTKGDSLGHYSYCTLTRGPIHGVFEVIKLGTQPDNNGVPLFRIEGTPEVIHRIQTGSELPESVVEAAAFFVQHLPQLCALGWKWETALLDDRDLFAGNPEVAEALSEGLV